MIPDMKEFLIQMRGAVWSPVFLAFLLSVALYYTFLLRGIQFRCMAKAFRLAVTPCREGKGAISPYEALMTTLAGAVGTGGIVGIATALSVGGVGAIFWVWVVGLLGMAITYAETLLAVEFRREAAKREGVCGGSMYIMLDGMQSKGLARVFAFFAMIASFGIGGTVQSNSVSDALAYYYQIPEVYTGAGLAMLAGCVIVGGIQRLGKVAAILVPFMGALLIGMGLLVIVSHISLLPAAFLLIFKSAWTGQGAIGGVAGVSVWSALQAGVARGVFSTEAGLGSATFPASAADTDHPVRQGLVSMTGTFLSALLVCSLTGLVLAVTQVMGQVDASGRLLDGAPLVIQAFRTVIPGAHVFVTICMAFFGFTTILAWAYCGEKSAQFLMGTGSVFPFRVVYVFSVVGGALLPVTVVWAFADSMNGLMALPHLIALVYLAPVVKLRSQEYGVLGKPYARSLEQSDVA